jgi:hypothetical protein
MATAGRYGPSAGRGVGSSGAAGRATPPMTPSGTPAYNNTSPSPSPPRRAPGPTSPQPNRWPARASSQHLISPRLDTGRLLFGGRANRKPHLRGSIADNAEVSGGAARSDHSATAPRRRYPTTSLADAATSVAAVSLILVEDVLVVLEVLGVERVPMHLQETLKKLRTSAS